MRLEDLIRNGETTLSADATSPGRVLTEQMMIDGMKALKALEDRRRQQRPIREAYALQWSEILMWLCGQGRDVEAYRASIIVACILEWGGTNSDSAAFLEGIHCEWEAQAK